MSLRDIRSQAQQGGKIVRGLESWRLKHERENGRKPDGYWHPSSISGCPTAAVYERLGFSIPGAPFDARLLRIFDVGHSLHYMLQTQFVAAGMVAKVPKFSKNCTTDLQYAVEAPIKDEEHQLLGTLDIVFEIKNERFVGEIKTKHSASFAKMVDAQEDHKVQAACYHWKALDYGWVNTDYAVCLYFSKDDSHMAEFKVPMTTERITKITDKLALMTSMVIAYNAAGTFPEPYYKESSKPPCRTCKWAQGCHSTLTRDSWIDSIKAKEQREQTNATTQVEPAKAQGVRKPPVRAK